MIYLPKLSLLSFSINIFFSFFSNSFNFSFFWLTCSLYLLISIFLSLSYFAYNFSILSKNSFYFSYNYASYYVFRSLIFLFISTISFLSFCSVISLFIYCLSLSIISLRSLLQRPKSSLNDCEPFLESLS